MQVDFYQLSRDPVDRVLPAIAARVLGLGERLLVVAQDEAALDRISAGLWNGPPESFLAHGRAGEGADAVQPRSLRSGLQRRQWGPAYRDCRWCLA